MASAADGEAPTPTTPAERRRRAAMLCFVSLLYLGGRLASFSLVSEDQPASSKTDSAQQNVPHVGLAGAAQAWRALRAAPADPHPELEALAGGAGSEEVPYSLRMHCASPVRAAVAHFSADGGAAAAAAGDVVRLLDDLLSPSLDALRPLIDVHLSSSAAMYTPANVLPGADASDADMAAAARALGWELHAQAVALTDAEVTMLLFTPPSSWQWEADADAGRLMRPPQAWQLADDVLLVVAAPGGSAALDRAADLAFAWLLRGFPQLLTPDAPGSEPAAAVQLAAACLGATASAAARVLAPGGALPRSMSAAAGQLVAAHASAAAAQASGEHAAALRGARAAWAAARALAAHPARAPQPVFPAEHALALLLPIGLPTLLVLAQAAGREVRAARQRRQKLKAA
jgi:hypothetical protein